MTSQWASQCEWRVTGEPIKTPVPVQRDGLRLVFLSDLEPNTEPSAPRDQLKSLTHDLVTISPSVDELPAANQVTTRKESQSYRMSGIENFNILGKCFFFFLPHPFLCRSPPRDRMGEGRVFAMLMLALSLFGIPWAVFCLFFPMLDRYRRVTRSTFVFNKSVI